MSEISVPVSPGELLDKITILRIKSSRMSDAKKVANVRVELKVLEETWSASPYARADIAAEVARKSSMPISFVSPGQSISRTTSGRPSSGASIQSSARPSSRRNPTPSTNLEA
jgi:hypothetical protein